jgi:riboflavin kinase/FMN adenylyltransferase
MRILRHGPAGVPTAIAIGSFDGVHLGHRAILERLADDARAAGLASAALTFEPLPREFFAPAQAPARLTSLGERLAAIAACGIDLAFVERFDRDFAALSPDAFARRLAQRYGARQVVVGPDFRYGAKRAGDIEMLADAGRALGFEVDVQEIVEAHGERISSTRIREALAAGDFALARRLLGRPYAICGRVVHGAKRGRALGYPTANVRLARPRPPLAGIYAVKCFGAATRGLEGVASLGTNPAVNASGAASLEAYLFDFSGDLYGRRISLEFVKKLRDESPFDSMEALAEAIRRDCEAAREIFRTQER